VKTVDLEAPMTQAAFGELVGITQQAVSDLAARGVLPAGSIAAVWLLAYCERLREQAAGRLSTDGAGPDLAHERALLAKAQREGQEIKNEVARGTYAPIDLLADVLANTSQAIVDRLEQIPSELKRRCPDLPPAAFAAVMTCVSSARNEAVHRATRLVDELLFEDQPVEDEPDDVPDDEPHPTAKD